MVTEEKKKQTNLKSHNYEQNFLKFDTSRITKFILKEQVNSHLSPRDNNCNRNFTGNIEKCGKNFLAFSFFTRMWKEK